MVQIYNLTGENFCYICVIVHACGHGHKKPNTTILLERGRKEELITKPLQLME